MQAEKGIIIADTKFEFGLDENGNIVLGDEMLTPDSSRFWPAKGYEPGHGQPSFDQTVCKRLAQRKQRKPRLGTSGRCCQENH